MGKFTQKASWFELKELTKQDEQEHLMHGCLISLIILLNSQPRFQHCFKKQGI